MLKRHAVAAVLMLSIWAVADTSPVMAGETTFALRVTKSDNGSFTVPLDAAALTYQRGWRPGPDDRPVHGISSAEGPVYDGYGFGMQMRIGRRTSPAELWLGWARTRSATATVSSSLEYNRVLEHIFCFAPPCPSPRLTQRFDDQSTAWDIRQQTLDFGISYDVLHGNKHVSVSPGLGLQWWNVSQGQVTNFTITRLIHPLIGDGPTRQEIVRSDHSERSRSTARTQGVLGLDVKIWPIQKNRGLALTAEGRHIIGATAIDAAGSTLIEPYALPVRQSRWQASVGLALGF